MIDIVELDKYQDSKITYGGHSGSKKGLIINNERWLIKYPKSTISMQVEGLSYTTTPISEYLGSKIYSSIGIDTHEVILGKMDGKIVVGCKDFLSDTETIFDFNNLKNNYDEEQEKYIINNSSSKSSEIVDIETIEFIMDNNEKFVEVPELKMRFWDMFIIDAFISNNDRNEGNWGLVFDRKTLKYKVAPVYDNGASFYGKSDDIKLSNMYKDTFKFRQMAYESSVCIFRKNDKVINPLKFIESMENDDCNKAIIRLFKRIDMEKIKTIFDDVPLEYDGLVVLSEIQRKVYYEVLKFRYNEILKPIYERLIKNI